MFAATTTAASAPLAEREPVRTLHADYTTRDGDRAALAKELRAYGHAHLAAEDANPWDRLAQLATCGY